MLAERRGPKSPDSVDVDVGRMIRFQRVAQGLTLTELATEIGVTFQQLQSTRYGTHREGRQPRAPTTAESCLPTT